MFYHYYKWLQSIKNVHLKRLVDGTVVLSILSVSVTFICSLGYLLRHSPVAQVLILVGGFIYFLGFLMEG